MDVNGKEVASTHKSTFHVTFKFKYRHRLRTEEASDK